MEGDGRFVRLKGVCYDAGREMMGRDWRPDFDPAIVRREIEIIRNDLHCNAIRLQGRSLDRLELASRSALDQGLEVWFSPELWDQPQDETVRYIDEAARVTQGLLETAPGKVVLSVGSEVMLFVNGIIPGDNVLERVAHPKLRELIMSPSTQVSLNTFLSRLAQTARQRFNGKLTYASIGMENVDWELFDYVGVDLYRGDPMFDRYPDVLARYASIGKPVVNTEFGCCTFRGAERMGGRGWEVVDWGKWPPRLKGDYIYDQTAQASELSALLRMNDEAGIYGTFVFTFVEPGAGLPDGREEEALRLIAFDPDLPHYSLVKAYPDRRRGAAYPDMTWEPKESFRAVADFYASH
jgi:hypothetical protein